MLRVIEIESNKIEDQIFYLTLVKWVIYAGKLLCNLIKDYKELTHGLWAIIILYQATIFFLMRILYILKHSEQEYKLNVRIYTFTIKGTQIYNIFDNIADFCYLALVYMNIHAIMRRITSGNVLYDYDIICVGFMLLPFVIFGFSMSLFHNWKIKNPILGIAFLLSIIHQNICMYIMYNMTFIHLQFRYQLEIICMIFVYIICGANIGLISKT
ncbi:hypothetical protein COBT_001760 [Conglomerata obtusa]